MAYRAGNQAMMMMMIDGKDISHALQDYYETGVENKYVSLIMHI